jgi:hypothetical protein
MMTFESFIENYDQENTVLLLAGKRDVHEHAQAKLIQLGEMIASNSKKLIFRTGNAAGADALFAEGVARIDASRLQSVTPYKNHRKKDNKAYMTMSLEDVNLVQEPHVVYQSKKNVEMGRLIDQFLQGERHRNAQKAAYILRDTLMVVGSRELIPAKIGIFYDDLKNPRQGGTGHTMRMCQLNEVPVLDQRVWMSWLE